MPEEVVPVPDTEALLDEAVFNASRSGGKGGQNVNKVSTKIELAFDVNQSLHLTDDQKSLIMEVLAARINSEGVLKIVSQEARSQLENRKIASTRFKYMIEKAFHKKKKRVPSRLPQNVKEERLKEKKRHSEKKSMRKSGYIP